MDELDFKKYPTNEFTLLLDKKLQKLIRKEIKLIRLENIPSNTFCELVNIEPIEVYGWECDWNGILIYKTKKILVLGHAWTGTITLSLI